MLSTLEKVGSALCALHHIRVTPSRFAPILVYVPSSLNQMLMGGTRHVPSITIARYASAVLTPNPIKKTKALVQNQRDSVVRTALLPTVTCYVSPLKSPQREVPVAEGGVEDKVVGEKGDVVAAMEELVEAVCRLPISCQW